MPANMFGARRIIWTDGKVDVCRSNYIQGDFIDLTATKFDRQSLFKDCTKKKQEMKNSRVS